MLTVRPEDQTDTHSPPFDKYYNITLCDNLTAYSTTDDTCCDNYTGAEIIYYSHKAPIPTATSDLSSPAGYYAPTSITMLSSTVPTRLPSAPSTATIQPTFAPSAPSRPRSTGLAEGSKVVIGLGVALGAILLGAVALYFFHKRRQNEVKAGNQIGHAAAMGEPPLEHGGQGYGEVVSASGIGWYLFDEIDPRTVKAGRIGGIEPGQSACQAPLDGNLPMSLLYLATGYN